MQWKTKWDKQIKQKKKNKQEIDRFHSFRQTSSESYNKHTHTHIL